LTITVLTYFLSNILHTFKIKRAWRASIPRPIT